MSQAEYNYRHFELGPADAAAFDEFRHKSRVGERAPDADLVDAVTEEPVKLSALWRERALILEFGSLT